MNASLLQQNILDIIPEVSGQSKQIANLGQMDMKEDQQPRRLLAYMPDSSHQQTTGGGLIGAGLSQKIMPNYLNNSAGFNLPLKPKVVTVFPPIHDLRPILMSGLGTHI